ncbi:recombinase family protein [Paracraurococcus lichenis]|uniref:Recombinase family protein n=1 Tax=Paracraurococcus lichenis TaxID=3064888 RepID=A0ABT9EAA2_9PROT|nr:recombinase family protein [Paracraurococcus sp. LOR1-02]MDO9713086.1 recombinase family protein [Paracraurococcus sp. LOR1-02]
MALVGYARVSTEDQATRRQLDELRTAGCGEVAEEHASGGDRDRPVLTRTLARLRPGDTLVVVSLDRLARSLSHLLEVIEGLQARGVHFRSLRDPVDTASPQGLFTLQVLGAAAQLERALIRERTRSGMQAAAARGRRAGNPGLRAGDPAAIRQVTAARRAAWLEGLAAGADAWLPAVRRLRAEGRPWEAVVRYLNARQPAGAPRWTGERLLRAVRALAAEGMAKRSLLDPVPRRAAPDRLLAVVAGIVLSDPRATLRQIGARLAALREPTPRGGAHWRPGSVAHVLARARKAGLLPAA